MKNFNISCDTISYNSCLLIKKFFTEFIKNVDKLAFKLSENDKKVLYSS